MKRNWGFVFLLLIFATLVQAQQLLPWANMRNSSYTSQDSICVRFEATVQQPPYLYATGPDGWQQYQVHSRYPGSWEGTIPYSDETTTNWRLDGQTQFGRVCQLPDFGTNAPVLIQYSKCASDPVNDSDVSGADYLEITRVLAATGNNRLYAALGNGGGGFPVSDSILGPYYIYVIAFADLNSAVNDSTAYAMVYADIPSFASPGLYAMDIADGLTDPLNAFERIGNINYQQEGSSLLMDCNMQDIASYASNWPPEQDLLTVSAMTIKVTLNGFPPQPEPVIADETVPVMVQLRNQQIEPYTNTLPVLSNATVDPGTCGVTLSVVYTDVDDNYPTNIQCALTGANNGWNYEMELLPEHPYGFSEGVVYSAVLEFISLPIGRELVDFNFWCTDNNTEFVTSTVQADLNFNPAQDDAPAYVVPTITAGPNPFSAGTGVNLRANNVKANCQAAVYSLNGRKVHDFGLVKPNATLNWDGYTQNGRPAAAGVYFYRIKGQGINLTKKLLLIK